jgi:hypothetical protein
MHIPDRRNRPDGFRFLPHTSRLVSTCRSPYPRISGKLFDCVVAMRPVTTKPTDRIVPGGVSSIDLERVRDGLGTTLLQSLAADA